MTNTLLQPAIPEYDSAEKGRVEIQPLQKRSSLLRYAGPSSCYALEKAWPEIASVAASGLEPAASEPAYVAPVDAPPMFGFDTPQQYSEPTPDIPVQPALDIDAIRQQTNDSYPTGYNYYIEEHPRDSDVSSVQAPVVQPAQPLAAEAAWQPMAPQPTLATTEQQTDAQLTSAFNDIYTTNKTNYDLAA